MTPSTVADVTLGTQVTLNLEWGARPANEVHEVQFDLDASAIACGSGPSGPKVLSKQHFIFYNNLRSPEGVIEHTGDNLTGKGDHDDEVIRVDLTKAPPSLLTIVLAVSIYDADLRRQSFRQVKDAVVKLVDQTTGKVVYSYDLSSNAGAQNAVLFGEISRQGNGWKFHFSGQSSPSGLAGIARQYGVEV